MMSPDVLVSPVQELLFVFSAFMFTMATVATCLYCFKSKPSNKGDDVEAENCNHTNREVSISPQTPDRSPIALFEKLSSLFSFSEPDVVVRSNSSNDKDAPKLYDKPPLGKMSLNLVQPRSRPAGADLLATSEKRPSIYDVGPTRSSERSRLTSASSFIPKGFTAPFEVETPDDEQLPTKYLGSIEFSAFYILEDNILRVKVLKAFDLPAMDFTGTSDPYVKCCLLPDRKRKLETKIRRKTLNPLWNETLSFEGLNLEKIRQRILYLQVMDYDRFSRNDPIGEICIPLHTINLEEETVLKRYLNPCHGSNKRGELLLSLLYKPIEGLLEVVIEKARNLKSMDIGGTSDPYVKIWLLHLNERVEKKKTATKKNTLNPLFGEKFVFKVPVSQLRDVQLAITVMDYDTIGRNDTIGKIYLGTKSTGLEKQHWKDMLSRRKETSAPGRKHEPDAVLQWHVLKV